MRANPDPTERRADWSRNRPFSFVRAPSAAGRAAREGAVRRAHVREACLMTAYFFVCVVVAACVSVWMCPPDGIETSAGPPASTSAD
jgi:hypothetical protein